MKLSCTTGLTCLALIITSYAHAYERQWNVEKAPPTWNIDLFESEAMHLPQAENSIHGILQSVPPIEWRSAEDIRTEWARLKAIDAPRAQLSAIRRSNILASACDELIDFRTLTNNTKLPIRWRDNHRGRTWVDPTTASTLLHAIETFQERLPGYVLTLGDMAQPGCGQLEYGTLVSHIHDTESSLEASNLLNQARMIGGVPAVQEMRNSGPQRTMVERTLLGHRFNDQDRLTLRVATRTYRRQRVGPQGPARKQFQRWDQEKGAVTVAETKRIVTTFGSGRSTRLWRHHWISEGRETQAILLSTRRLDLEKPLVEQFDYVREMRFSRWDAKKPLSYKSERRWVRRANNRAIRWETWALIHEAGHQTHTSGRDVDISYVTKSNQRHFNGSWKAIDSRRTWKWFQILVQAAQDVGVKIERILVGPRVHRILRRRLPKKTRRSALFRSLLRQVDGHDAHHHLRISPSEHLPLAVIPWIWRIDEPLQNLFDGGLGLLQQ